MVGPVTVEAASDQLAHPAARTVAPHDVRGAQPARRPGAHVAHGRLDRAVAVGDHEVDQLETVVGSQPRRRRPHRLQQVVVHPCLVEDEVGHLAQPVLHVLDPAGARDHRRTLGIGAPEPGLVDLVGLLQDPPRDPERLEHLHAAAGDTVGLAELERPLAALHHHGPDGGEASELGREDQTCGARADDEDVDLLVDVLRRAREGGRRGGGRVAGVEAVSVELHWSSWGGGSTSSVRQGPACRTHVSA
ncbi:hypothetical protein JOE61_001666 [Nocardioides salarius]|uniref:Uncharacterized protein n=1 Tax=Nocardioides salarius TaxID=374513 RepID=A0ABS2M9H9_9ACTN|nr:hypothetical protein [Nocardioides salarius]